LRSANARAKTVAIKLRYAHFRTITRQQTLALASNSQSDIEAAARQLLEGTVLPGDRFRLLGIQCSKLVDESGVQGVLWEPIVPLNDHG
jgi:DNA polymerase-4